MAPLTLGYWDIRGLAEPIRMLLHYKKVEFTDKRYKFQENEWTNDKFNLGLDFPNLPYLFDGEGVKISQSTTILRYLAEKYHLGGTTPEERLKVSLVEQQIHDMRWRLFLVMFAPDFDKAKADFVASTPDHLKLYEKFLGGKDYLVGEGITYVDFLFSEVFDFYRYFVPEVCKNFPVLKAHQDRVMSLPELKDYLKSSTYVRWPIFGPLAAKFGGAGPEPKRD